MLREISKLFCLTNLIQSSADLTITSRYVYGFSFLQDRVSGLRAVAKIFVRGRPFPSLSLLYHPSLSPAFSSLSSYGVWGALL